MFKNKIIFGFFVSLSGIREYLKLWMIIPHLFSLSNTSLLMNQKTVPVALIHYTGVIWSLIYSWKGRVWFEIRVHFIMYIYSHVLNFTRIIGCRSSMILRVFSRLWLICLSYDFWGFCLCRCFQWYKYKSLFFFLIQCPIF